MPQFFNNLSIRNKLITVILLTSFITVALALSLFNLKEVFNYRQIAKNNLTILAQVVGQNCASAMLFNDSSNATENLSYLSIEPEIIKAILFDKKNQTFATYHHQKLPSARNVDASTSDQPIKPEQIKNFHDQGLYEGLPFFDKYLDVIVPILFNDEKLGNLYIQYGMDSFYRELLARLFALIIILLGASIFAYLLAHKSQKLFTTPITNLVSRIGEITQNNDYQIRIENPYKQEFGILISGFNNMLIQIQKRDEELEAHRDHLENEVWQRTQDLQMAMLDLTKAKEAAEASDRAKSEFLANMSHELRTPLNHIIGFTDLVLSQKCGTLNELQNEYLSDVTTSSQHLLSLINDILDLAKVEADKMELELGEIQIVPFLEQSLKMVKERALNHQLQLAFDVESDLGLIQADERKLKQILYNLLSNATKFTPDGGRITVTAERSLADGQTPGANALEQSEWLKISIKDSGIGISAEDLERIFKSFEQADSSASRQYQGTGLGLSLTRRMVELHGGRIWASSKGTDMGSTFSFIIPIIATNTITIKTDKKG